MDPLKIACLLRVADASHIDARRAPSFLRALRRPNAVSDAHWSFQEKLQKPHVADDALVYTSGYAFPFSEAAAWWLCWDTLTMIDRELRQVDALLADKHQARFLAHRVAGVESPERIVTFLPTNGWLPIDAQVQVSDVPKLVLKMGGSELYGKKLSVAVRELVQNSTDAIRARRITESRDEKWGVVTVRTGKDRTGEWLEVEDNGIGMSEQVLRRYLLDFGNSYWGSPLMLEEFPGLLANGLNPIGKYGIGFFSVFMLGSAIRVRTRRADAAQNSTLVMEFNTGLTIRPVIRHAETAERLKDGGSAVRVWLEKPAKKAGGLLSRGENKEVTSLSQLCRNIAPCLDVSLFSDENGKSENVIEASDWKTCDPRKFILRLPTYGETIKDDSEIINNISKNIRTLSDKDGNVVGRGCIGPHRFDDNYPHGLVTVGGLAACNLSGFIGALEGKAKRASRDSATPVVDPRTLANWASEQAKLIFNTNETSEMKSKAANLVRRFGGNVGNLPIAKFRGHWITYDQLAKTKDIPGEVILISPYSCSEFEKINGFNFDKNTIIVEYSSWDGILSDMHDHEWPGWPDKYYISWKQKKSTGFNMTERTLGGLVIESLAIAWKLKTQEIIENNTLNREKNIKIGTLKDEPIFTGGLVIRRKPAKEAVK